MSWVDWNTNISDPLLEPTIKWSKPWLNGLTSQRKFSTSVHATCVSFGHLLVWTCDDLRWLWSSSNSYRKSTQVFHRLATQRKSTQVDRNSTVYTDVKFMTFCDLRELARRLGNPFGHPSQIRTQVLVLRRLVSTCESVWPGFSEHSSLWIKRKAFNTSFGPLSLVLEFY